MQKITKLLRLGYLSAAVALAACGGSENDAKPTVQVGATMSLKEGRTATAQAVVSDDRSGYKINWRQLSGPALQLANINSQSVTITAPALSADAVALLQVSVTDSAGQSASAELKVELKNNLPPVIKAEFPQVTEKSMVQLNIEATDSDGQVKTIQWQQLSGPTLTLGNTSQSKLTLQTPAVSKVEIAKLQINVTDDDGEVQSLQKDLRIEPLWQDVHISGHLVAKGMNGAKVLALVNGETFQSTADGNGAYQLKLQLDDDAENDLVMVRAISESKTGMELWAAIPAVLSQDPTVVNNLTAFSTSTLALVVRANQGVVPKHLAELRQLEQKTSSYEAAESGYLIAAFAEKSSIKLPAGMPNVFRTVVENTAYQDYRLDLMLNHADVLAQLESRLPQQGSSQVDLTAADLSAGLRLVTGDTGRNNYSRFYQLDAQWRGQMADHQLSLPAQWNILSGAMYLSATTNTLPLFQLPVTNPNLSLSPADVARLQAAGISQLQVRINNASERMIRLSQGASQSLFLHINQLELQPQPVVLDGQTEEFTAVDIETEQYVWGSVLHPQTLTLSAEQLVGAWQLPLFSAGTNLESSQFTLQDVELQLGGAGVLRQTNQQFSWSVQADPQGGSLLRLTFANQQSLELRLFQKTANGYKGDLFAKDTQGKWLAAQYALLIKLSS